MKKQNLRFKPYHQNQGMLFPPTYEELIPKGHPVRIVNDVIDRINIDKLLSQYPGGGCSNYHPRVLIKILIYGYLCNVYSSRKLEQATRENINYIWLSGNTQPDHNTINRFRSEKLKDVIKDIFTQVVLLMVDSGNVDLESVYTDGTKIESKANRYSFVWGRAIKASKERISKQLEELWDYTQKIASEELMDNSPTTFKDIDPEQVKQTIEKIEEALKDKPVPVKVKQKIKYGKKNWPAKLKEYTEKQELLQERNSYSKTDTDATFMKMKEDHMNNSQLKPGYNVQISTNDQVIVNYSIHQNPTDTKTLKPHLEEYKKQYGHMPKTVTADAGYGSEENYEFLESNQVDAFVKYNYFEKEQHHSDKTKGPFHVDSLYYNVKNNCYYCPMGQPMYFIGIKEDRTEAGYIRTLHRYQAQNCNSCQIRGRCYKGKANRIVEVSHRLNELKSKVRNRLLSEEGIKHRKKRPVDVEPVFGMIKYNRGFKRFLLKGLIKVNIEFGLVAIAHNLRKMGVFFDLSIFRTIPISSDIQIPPIKVCFKSIYPKIENQWF